MKDSKYRACQTCGETTADQRLCGMCAEIARLKGPHAADGLEWLANRKRRVAQMQQRAAANLPLFDGEAK